MALQRDYQYFSENERLPFVKILTGVDSLLNNLDAIPVSDNEQYWANFLANWQEMLTSEYHKWSKRDINKDFPLLIQKLNEKMTFSQPIKQGEYLMIKTNFIVELGYFLSDLLPSHPIRINDEF